MVDLVSVWLGEDQRNKLDEDTCFEEIGLHLQILLTASHSSECTIARDYQQTSH
jgi:hypothetical protein